MSTSLAKLSKIQTLYPGEIEFASHGTYDDHTVTIRYNITNRTSEVVHVKWDPVATLSVPPRDPWEQKSVVSLDGWLGVLHKPVNATSNAIVTRVGGKNDIEGVPIYLTSREGFTEFIKRIPGALIAGAKVIVKHYIGGNSPGVILTAEAMVINESRFRYRYTATAEGDVSYLVNWGSLLDSNMLVSRSNGEKVIAEFNAQGAVGLLKTFAVMAREGDSNQFVTLAPMPFPQQEKENQMENLQESSSSAYISATRVPVS